jgi:hypothetical protein
MTRLNKTIRNDLVRRAGLLLPGAANALAAPVIESAGFSRADRERSGHRQYVFRCTAHPAPLADGAPDARGSGARRREYPDPCRCRHRLWQRDQHARVRGCQCRMLKDQTFPNRCGHFDSAAAPGRRDGEQAPGRHRRSHRLPEMITLVRTDTRGRRRVGCTLMGWTRSHLRSRGAKRIEEFRARDRVHRPCGCKSD